MGKMQDGNLVSGEAFLIATNSDFRHREIHDPSSSPLICNLLLFSHGEIQGRPPYNQSICEYFSASSSQQLHTISSFAFSNTMSSVFSFSIFSICRGSSSRSQVFLKDSLLYRLFFLFVLTSLGEALDASVAETRCLSQSS
jgi:hypothetical protein